MSPPSRKTPLPWVVHPPGEAKASKELCSCPSNAPIPPIVAITQLPDLGSTVATRRSGGEEIDDLLNGFVGAVVGRFEFAVRLVIDVGTMVKGAVGEWSAEPFVEEEEEQGNLDPFWCEIVGVAGSVTPQQRVGFELAQVVAELVQAVGSVGEVEGSEDGVVDLLGGPAADLTAAM